MWIVFFSYHPASQGTARRARTLAAGLPFLEIRLVDQEEFDFYTGSFYATDRDLVQKGTVEVIL